MGLLAGFVVDRVFGDPARYHPVAALGRAAGVAERAMYRDSRPAGLLFTTVCAGSAWGAGRLVGGSRPEWVRAAVTASTAWSALGGTTLTRIGDEVADALDAGDLDAARALLPSLCGRDPSVLDGAGIARAALESIAENTSDAAVAPLVWGAVAGVPGLVVYRTVNTLDAMVGYRTDRHGRFGWASARLDDLANIVPARITGVLAVVLGPDAPGAVRAWRRDARRHPSPNAGVAEAAFAGALGVTLGGRTEYPHGVEERPRLGDGPAPDTADLRAAVALSRRIQVATAVGAAGLAAVLSRRSVR
ncbi:putative adenosylcobinamide-phosphate synthase [Gordonia rhizosphera NBRC 16068]|uniref:Cobalamin biosynthesis protein CobD n=1 Tax=Gordonia rhizosphera NBRC 16068 TaxID=1108045 RepID=K6WEC8_9ACTN|nr:putative adenosylcobinamide-phosphate synthase [Gordonia rhizosphera NBRC 16068]